ncbi:MAG TPA: fatty acid desaturase [Burkholderiales bacterium]|nr:fatty acid desaturase [Burkholderiales bacterium]
MPTPRVSRSAGNPGAPDRFNILLALCFVAAGAWQLVLLPLLLLPRNGMWGLTLIPLALLTNTLWALIHEAIHGSLHSSRRVNAGLGRALAIVFGAPFALLRWGHLLHHAYSRTPRERSEVFDPAQTGRRRFAYAYYFRLCGGLYLAEVLGAPLLLMPERWLRRAGSSLARDDNVVALLLQKLAAPQTLREARLDAAVIVALLIASAWCYGAYFWMLAAALLARGFLVSVTDNVYHYGTPLTDVRAANNLELPRPLQALLLNFNLHGVHHRAPDLGWRALEAEFRRVGAFDGDFAAALLDQFRGPLPLTAFNASSGADYAATSQHASV